MAVLLSDMCIEMDASWYSSNCHDAGLKKKHRTEKTILCLNVKDIFAPLNFSGIVLLLLLLLLLSLQGMLVLLL